MRSFFHTWSVTASHEAKYVNHYAIKKYGINLQEGNRALSEDEVMKENTAMPAYSEGYREALQTYKEELAKQKQQQAGFPVDFLDYFPEKCEFTVEILVELYTIME